MEGVFEGGCWGEGGMVPDFVEGLGGYAAGQVGVEFEFGEGEGVGCGGWGG